MVAKTPPPFPPPPPRAPPWLFGPPAQPPPNRPRPAPPPHPRGARLAKIPGRPPRARRPPRQAQRRGRVLRRHFGAARAVARRGPRRLSATRAVPPAAGFAPGPDRRPLPRRAARSAPARFDLSASVDRPPVRPARAAVRPDDRTRNRVLRQRPRPDAG